jgi:hypothetical protein
MSRSVAIVVIYFLLVLFPGVPLMLVWRRVLTRRDAFVLSNPIAVKLPLLSTTASDLLFLVYLLAPSIAGRDYSYRRFVTIWINLGLALLMLAFSLTSKNPFRALLAMATGAVALVWLYAWAVNAAV